MKRYIFIIIFSIVIFEFSFASDFKGGRDDHSFLKAKNSNFIKGSNAIKRALKYEKKNITKKANKQFEKAIKYFVLAHKENPNNIETLNNLGFSYYNVGDLIMSEIYYQEGLIIDPKNNSINQGLGTLYFKTNRKNLAMERLDILSSCNCQEYLDLKSIIESN